MNICATPGTAFQADGLEQEHAMDNQSKTMPPHDKRQSIDIDQDSVFSKITSSADKLTARSGYEHYEVLDETYYKMPATSRIVRDTIFDNNKLSS